MASVKVDPDFAIVAEALSPREKPDAINNALEYRANVDRVIGSLLNFPVPSDVVETKHVIRSSDGAEVALYHFVKAGGSVTTPQPALLYAHGGGTIACPVDRVTRPGIARLVSESGVQAFAVEYRLAPEFPYPTPLEDCYAALQWIQSQAQVDGARVAVMGESAGGLLAAGLSLLARDRALSPPIAKQILLYPMLDDGATAHVELGTPRGEYLASWVNMTDICWDAYLGAGKRGRSEANVPSYASPARAENLGGLPPAYIDVGSLDLFRDESLAYGSRLAIAGVDVELHLYDGLPHVFDLVAPGISATLNAKDNRYRAIRRL